MLLVAEDIYFKYLTQMYSVGVRKFKVIKNLIIY